MTSFKLDGTDRREVKCPFQKMEVRLTIIFSASPLVHLKVMAPLMNGNPHKILKKRRNKSYKGVTRCPKESHLRASSCKERSDLSSVSGSILHSIARNLLCTLALYNSYFAFDTHIGIFPTPTHVLKLGNEFALQGVDQRKEEACSGANVPWCYLAVSEKNSATDQEKPSLKSVALSQMLF